jgi:hypothetical protein
MEEKVILLVEDRPEEALLTGRACWPWPDRAAAPMNVGHGRP